MQSTQRHGMRRAGSGVALVALVALSGCGVPDRAGQPPLPTVRAPGEAGQSPFPTSGVAGEVLLTFVFPSGAPSLFSEQEIIFCVGSQPYYRPTQVRGREDALQVAVPVETMLAQAGAVLDVTSYQIGREPVDGGCSARGAGNFDRVDPAQTIYIKHIKTQAVIQADIQYALDNVVNPATRATLSAALAHVAASAAPELWLDERHLNPATGDQVFTELMAAVELLTPLRSITGSESGWQQGTLPPIDPHAPPPTPEPTPLPDSQDGHISAARATP